MQGGQSSQFHEGQHVPLRPLDESSYRGTPSGKDAARGRYKGEGDASARGGSGSWEATRMPGLYDAAVYARCTAAVVWLAALNTLALPLAAGPASSHGWGKGAVISMVLITLHFMARISSWMTAIAKRVGAPAAVVAAVGWFLPLVALLLSPLRLHIVSLASLTGAWAVAPVIWPRRGDSFIISPFGMVMSLLSAATHCSSMFIVVSASGGGGAILSGTCAGSRDAACMGPTISIMLITTLIAAFLAAADAQSFRVVLPPVETPLSQRLAATAAPLLRKSLSRAFYALFIFGAGILVAAGRIWMKDGGECLRRVGGGDDESALLMTEGQRGQQAVIIIATLTNISSAPRALSATLITVTFVVFAHLMAQAAVSVWASASTKFADRQASTPRASMAPLLRAVAMASIAPQWTSITPSDPLGRFSFLRTALYREVASVASSSPQMLGVIFEASETWEVVLSKHLDTLRELSRSMREIATQSNAVSLKKAARGDSGFVEGVAQSLVVRAPTLASNFGLDALDEDSSTLRGLRESMGEVLDTLDMHSECVASLSKLLVESQKVYKDRERNFRADPRGLCILAVGPVLAQLLELTMSIEAVVETDAHVPPQIKLPLGANQMCRHSLHNLSISLDHAIYSIIVAYHSAVPDIIGQATSECRLWLPWCDRPERVWKEEILPRLQTYMAFKTGVLPVGEPTARRNVG